MRLYIPSLVMAAVFGGQIAASAQTQSLADVAKKEEERRKSVKTAGKVYTNKDLGGAVDAAAPAPAPAAPAAAAADTAKPAEPAKPQEPVKDQAYWSQRLKELQSQVARDETYAEAMQTRINSLSADFVNRDDPAQRAALAADRQKAVAELERLRQQIEAGKKAIADLEEEARRAGVPPGWLR
jgi:hypothetical protein